MTGRIAAPVAPCLPFGAAAVLALDDDLVVGSAEQYGRHELGGMGEDLDRDRRGEEDDERARRHGVAQLAGEALLVDDSAVVRQMLTEILSSDPAIDVVGTAAEVHAPVEERP